MYKLRTDTQPLFIYKIQIVINTEAHSKVCTYICSEKK